jgi:hypothetical protein
MQHSKLYVFYCFKKAGLKRDFGVLCESKALIAKFFFVLGF